VVAVVEDGLPRVLPDEHGCITVPSWVAFTEARGPHRTSSCLPCCERVPAPVAASQDPGRACSDT